MLAVKISSILDSLVYYLEYVLANVMLVFANDQHCFITRSLTFFTTSLVKAHQGSIFSMAKIDLLKCLAMFNNLSFFLYPKSVKRTL